MGSRGEAQALDRAICALICRSDGIKAREIAAELGLERKLVNSELYRSPLMRELCWQDRDCRWHGIVRQARPHMGLQEFAGYYGLNFHRKVTYSMLCFVQYVDKLTRLVAELVANSLNLSDYGAAYFF